MNDDKNIKKPLTLIRDDFVNNLAELCNNSGLPFFIIEDVLKSFIQEVHIASQKQFEIDKIQYNKSLQETKS